MTENQMPPANAGEMQDSRFKPGVSGNPAGKPKGARNKATEAAMMLLEGEAQALTRKAIEKALEGDATALRLCLERIAPASKSSAQPVTIGLPKDGSLTDTAHAIVEAAANGEIPPDIAAQLVSAVANVCKVEEITELKERLTALERATAIKKEKRK